MGFKEVSSLDAEVTISLGGVNKKTGKKNPTSVEGYYLGSRTVEGKKGDSKIHFFQTSKGNLGVWGKTDSDRKLGGVAPGTMTRISFDKMQATPNGDMYKYKVEVDADNTIDVGDLGGSTEGASPAYNAFESAEELGYASDEDTSDADQEAELIAAQSTAERKAKVQALLNGKGKKA